MGKYHRAKREDANKSSQRKITIRIGCAMCDYEFLESLCKDKSIELMKTIELDNGEEIEVEFWTASLPAELIGISTIRKSKDGVMSFFFDGSETTL